VTDENTLDDIAEAAGSRVLPAHRPMIGWEKVMLRASYIEKRLYILASLGICGAVCGEKPNLGKIRQDQQADV